MGWIPHLGSGRLSRMRTYLGSRALFLLAASAFPIATPASVSAQSPGARRSSLPDTGTSFTSDMRLLDGRLLQMTREPLQRSGHSFYAFALYVADTAGPPNVYEYGVESAPLLNDPPGIADALRSAVRKHQSSSPEARTVGIIVDSIAGPFDKAVDGSYGPPFRRVAVTELEDRSGRCRRIEREYHFAKDPPEDGRDAGTEWGRIVYGDARVSRCRPRSYWPTATVVATPTRPHLAAPIVRPLFISSLDNHFSVVGRFSGALTVFDDSIVVRFDSLIATRRLPDDPQRIRLDSIRVGVGMGTDTAWSPVDDSKALSIESYLAKGEVIEHKNVRFVVHHERRQADDDAWLVVTFHITVDRDGDSESPKPATTYAHSRRRVLASEK
jgi:hypothetical protein